MTPDELPADMEAVVARLEMSAIDPVPWPDLRALLKAYQEQRRALEAASPVVPVGSREEFAQIIDLVAWEIVDTKGTAAAKFLGLTTGNSLAKADRILAALRPTDTGREA